ncbi:MAG TPA: SurA N-terminal domain-containing protein [Spongiibacteraceae bacterium]
MLQKFRDNMQGIVTKVIIGFIVVSFAIFGIETLIGNSGPTEVAKVNGDKIAEGELQQAIAVQKRQLLATMGDNVQPNMLDDAALRGPALDSLISQRLLQQSAADLKLSMPIPIVDQTILSLAPFQDNGKFSPERYQTLLRSQGYTPVYFKHMLQQELVVNQLHSGLADSEFVTSKELQIVAGLLQQQRAFNYMTIPLSDLANKISVSDADSEAYYREHSDQFLRDERVKLEYIELRAEDFAAPLDDATLKAEYDREMAADKNITERRAAHILIEINSQRNEQQARELADSIAKKIAAGEDFTKLAAQYSDDLGSKNSGGDLGMSTGATFPPLFEETLAKMRVGEVSAPVKSESGFHLIKLVDQQTKEQPTFAEKKAEITQRLLQAKAQPELLKNVEKLRDLVFNSDGLTGPANELKLPVHESGWLERKNSDPLFGNEKIIGAAFSPEVLKEHNNSEVLELAPDHYIVVRVKEHEAATPKPLETVKNEIVAALKQQRARAQAKQIADELSQHLQQGEEFKKLAAMHGYAAKSAEKATRSGGAIAPDLLRAVFAMPRPVAGKPLPLHTVNAPEGDIVLLQLTEVVEGAPDSLNPAQRTAVIAQLQQGLGSADFVAFMENLRARAEIKRH